MTGIVMILRSGEHWHVGQVGSWRLLRAGAKHSGSYACGPKPELDFGKHPFMILPKEPLDSVWQF
jgi:hypothetical protein